MLKRHVKNCDKVLDNRNHVLQSAQSISDKCRENISKEHLNILDSRDIINNNNKMEKCARFLQEKSLLWNGTSRRTAALATFCRVLVAR